MGKEHKRKHREIDGFVNGDFLTIKQDTTLFNVSSQFSIAHWFASLLYAEWYSRTEIVQKL
jgi:hypothetical protein